MSPGRPPAQTRRDESKMDLFSPSLIGRSKRCSGLFPPSRYADRAGQAAPRTGIGRVRHQPNLGQDQKSLRPARPALRVILISHFGQLGVLKSPRVTWLSSAVRSDSASINSCRSSSSPDTSFRCLPAAKLLASVEKPDTDLAAAGLGTNAAQGLATQLNDSARWSIAAPMDLQRCCSGCCWPDAC